MKKPSIMTILFIFIMTINDADPSELMMFDSANSPLTPSQLRTLCVDSMNNLWVGTSSNIYKKTNNDWEVIAASHIYGYVLDIAVSPEGDVWFVVGNGPYKKNLFSFVDNKWESYVVDEYLSSPGYIYIDETSKLWLSYTTFWQHQLGVAFLGIFDEDTLITKVPDDFQFGMFDFIVIQDTAYIITPYGLLQNYQDDWVYIYPPNFDYDNYSISSDFQLNAIEIYKNKILIGGEIFLVYENEVLTEISCIDSLLEMNEDEIMSICIQNDSTVWLGSDKGTLIKYNYEQYKIVYQFENHPILDIELDKNGNIWFIAKDVGLALHNEDKIVYVDKKQNDLSPEFTLYQNYPNPFNPSTTITYNLPKSIHVKLTIYNLMGQEIVTLIDEKQNPGDHWIEWHGRNDLGKRMDSGSYLYTIEADTYRQAGKMILLK